jgi:DNA-binding XRE family transcriptional regulator
VQPIPRYQLKKELVGGIHVEVIDAVSGLVCNKCGDVVRADVPDRPSLLAAIAVSRCKESLKLNGDEIRFLRKSMGFTASALAQKMKVSEETISRWENSHLAISSHAERILRWRVCQVLTEQAPAIEWGDDEILSMSIVSVRANPLVLSFHRVPYRRREQWREAA